MRELVGLLKEKVTTAIAVGARPSLAADGVDVTTWRSSALAPRYAVALVDGTVAAALTSPAGGAEGVELWGFMFSQWWLIAILHDGATINIAGDVQGFAQVLADIGDVERLAVAATVSAGAVTVKFCPMESHTC